VKDPALELSAFAETLLFGAARAELVARVIRPALAEGKIVICDRYIDSTVAYQGGARGIAETAIETLALSLDLLEPDGTILLDLEPELGLARARDRNQLQGSSLEEGRFEAEELSFHKAVREAYLRLAGRWPERIRIVQACGTPDEVFSRITPHLEEWITTVLGKGL